MTLSAAKLETALRRVMDDHNKDVNGNPDFVGWPATVIASASNWADAYDTYAKDAVDLSTDTLVTANKALFISTLGPLLLASVTGAIAAVAFDAAFIAYWTGAVFKVGIPPAPTVTCPNVGGTGVFASETTSIVNLVTPLVLSGLLVPIFADIANASTPLLTSPQLKAQKIANAFHTATTTAVFALITGVDPIGSPITNTCTIS